MCFKSDPPDPDLTQCPHVISLASPCHRFGRKALLIWSCLQTAVSGSSAAFAPSFTAYCIFRFLSGMALSGVGLNCVSLCKSHPGRCLVCRVGGGKGASTLQICGCGKRGLLSTCKGHFLCCHYLQILHMHQAIGDKQEITFPDKLHSKIFPGEKATFCASISAILSVADS